MGTTALAFFFFSGSCDWNFNRLQISICEVDAQQLGPLMRMAASRVKQYAKCFGYEPLRHTVGNLAAHGVQHGGGTRCADIAFDHPRFCIVIKHYKIEQDKCGTRCATQLWHTGHICIFRSKGSLS